MLSQLLWEDKKRHQRQSRPASRTSSRHSRGSSPASSRSYWPDSPPASLPASWTSGTVTILPLNPLPTSRKQSDEHPSTPPAHLCISFFPPYPDDAFDVEAQRLRPTPKNSPTRNLLPEWMATPNRWLNTHRDYIRSCAIQWGPAIKPPQRRE